MSIHKIAVGLAVTILCGVLSACGSKNTVYGGGKFVVMVNKSGSNLISIITMTKKNNHDRFWYRYNYEEGTSFGVNINRSPVELTTISNIFLYYDDKECNSFITNMVDKESIKVREQDKDRDYGVVRYVPVNVMSQIGNHCKIFATYDLNSIYTIFSKATSRDYYGYLDPSGRLIPVANREAFFKLKRQEVKCKSEWEYTYDGCELCFGEDDKHCKDVKPECIGGMRFTQKTVCKKMYYSGGGQWDDD